MADLRDHVDIAVVEDHIDTHFLGHGDARVVAIDADDHRRAEQPCADGGAKADRALREDRHLVAEGDLARFGATDTGGGDVGQENDLLVGELVRDDGHVRLCVRHEQILRLRAVDRVAEPPAAERLTVVAVPALGVMAGQTGIALPARRDRAYEHAIANVVPGDAGAELRDDADRLMPDDQPRPDRVLPFDDMQVRPANRGRRDPDQRLARPGMWPRNVFHADVARAMEHRGAHGPGGEGFGFLERGDECCRHGGPPRTSFVVTHAGAVMRGTGGGEGGHGVACAALWDVSCAPRRSIRPIGAASSAAARLRSSSVPAFRHHHPSSLPLAAGLVASLIAPVLQLLTLPPGSSAP